MSKATIENPDSDGPITLLFSGGVDSTMAACRLAEEHEQVHLLSFENGYGHYKMNRTTRRAEEVKRRYPGKVTHSIISIQDLFEQMVVNTLEEFAPGLKESILHRQVLTPWDLEKDFGLTEGNIFHGELSVEQLAFLRPAPGWAHYRTPISRLWLCGSGAHPGGGVMGAPGALAAQRMLKEHAV